MITHCRSCQSRNLVDVATIGRQALSIFGDKRSEEYGLDLIICTNCSLVQLKESTPPEKLYTENYGYRSGINNTIKADLKDVVERATKGANLLSGDIVLDIGANDGTLLSNYDTSLTRIGVEPIKKLAEECKKHADYVVNDFFSFEAVEGVLKGKKAKIITVISCFYDLEDPNKFVSDLVKILDDDGILIIEQNYLPRMLQQNAFDNIVHEHIEYYSLTSLEHLLNKHYLEVVGMRETSINGGAFRVYVKHMNTLDRYRRMEEKMKINNKWTYMLFSLRIQKIKAQLVKFIKDETDKGKIVYAYGASTRGNSLLQYCGLDSKLIKAAVERNPEKWGKNISSLNIPIISEEQARKDKPDYMLILPWFFKEEFLVREKAYLEAGGHFIFPLPEVEVI